MRPFLEAIDSRVLVCDGAMGTMLYAKGVFINRSFDALNVTQPELVTSIHQEYVRAGADVIETNTFGANPVKLETFGLTDRLHEINAAGARLARRAARERAWVAGSMGPLGIRIEPWGKTGVDEAEAFFKVQAQALLDGGVDLFVLETFGDLNEIAAAIAAIRSICDLPIVAQMTTEENGNSLDGTPPEKFAPELLKCGADVIGLNCSVGPAPMLEALERIERVSPGRLSAQPNAGRPRDIEGRTLYLCSPEYMASYARRFVPLGAALIGGCCGTTPEHIRQIKLAVQSLAPSSVTARTGAFVAPTAAFAGESVETPPLTPAPPIPREQKSRMAHALARGKFVLAVEMLPPKGHDSTSALDYARILKIRGVDAVTIPDGPRGSARMSALSLSVLVQQQAGIEPLLQYACRDRHLLGMQSDLLGAHAVGLRNLLLFTGDPRKIGDYSDATVVIEVDSIGLTNAVSRLNRGCDVGGQAIGPPTAFHIGVVANPTAPDLDEEIRRFEFKVEAGAEFAVTPPLYDAEAVHRFVARTAHVRIPLIAALRPLDSLRHAEYLANEVPNVHVPPRVVERIRQAGSAERETAEGIAIAIDIAREVHDAVQGLQVGGPQAAVLAVIETL